MEHSMRLVQEHCSRYLSMFGECVKNFPHTWHLDCEPERRKLARCAETNPEIVHIKTTCAKEFSVYESCMNQSRANSEKCGESFAVFTECASHAMNSYLPKGHGTPTLMHQSSTGVTEAPTLMGGPADIHTPHSSNKLNSVDTLASTDRNIIATETTSNCNTAGTTTASGDNLNSSTDNNTAGATAAEVSVSSSTNNNCFTTTNNNNSNTTTAVKQSAGVTAVRIEEPTTKPVLETTTQNTTPIQTGDQQS